MAIDPSILLQAKQIGFNPIDQVRQEKLKQIQEQAAQGQLTLQNQDIQHNQAVAQQQADAQRQEAAFQAAIKVNPNLDDNAVVGLLGSQRGSQFLKAREDSKSSLATRQKNMAEAKAKQTEIDSNYAGGLARTVIESNYDPLVISHVLDLAGQDPDHAQQVQQIRQQLTQGGPDSAKFIFKTLYNTSQTTAQAAAEKASKDRLSIEDSHNKALEANQAATNERLVQSGARQEANDKFRQAVDLKRLGLEQQRVGIEQQKAQNDPGNVDMSTANSEQRGVAKMLVEGKIGIEDLPTRGNYRTVAANLANQMDPTFTKDRRKTMQLFKNGKEADNFQGLATLSDHLQRYIQNSEDTGWTGKFNPLSTSAANMKADAKDIAGITNKIVNGLGLSKYQAEDYAKGLNSSVPAVRASTAREMYKLAEDKIREAKLKYEKGTGQEMPESLLRGTSIAKKSADNPSGSRPSLDSFEK